MKNLILFVCLISSASVVAQNTIHGVISDAENNELLPNVYVFIPDLQKGTVTNFAGEYELKDLPGGFLKIQYSFVGYKTQIQTIELKGYSLNQNIALYPTVIQTQEITVTGGQAGVQHENAIKIETIKKGELDNAPVGNLMKGLSQIPGIDAISKGNNIATPVIRGLSTNNIVVLNDGIRMENFQFSEDHPYSIDAGDLSTVEVIKGPASLLYGSDAVGGVLNFIKEPPAAINTTKIVAQSECGTNDKSNNTSFNIKSSSDKFFGGVSGNLSSSADYFGGDNRSVPNTRSNTYSAKIFGGYRNNKSIYKMYYDYNKMQLGITNPPALKIVLDNKHKNRSWYQNLDNHMLLSKNTFFFNQLKIDVDISYQYNHRRLLGNPERVDFELVDMKLNTLTWQAKGRYDFSGKSNFIIGIQGLVQNNRNRMAPNHILPDYSILANSLAGLWQCNLNDRMFYQIGARYDYKQIAAPTQLNSFVLSDTLPSFNKNYGNLSFSTGLTYKLVNNLLFRANLASAFRTPNVAELLQDGVHGNRYEKGNRNFISQRNIEGDVSLHLHTNNLVVDISTYLNRIFNYIYLAPTNSTSDNGLDIFSYTQNNAKLYGVECSAGYSFLNKFEFKTTFAHIRALQDDGANLPFIPQDKINLSLQYSKKCNTWIDDFQMGVNPLVATEQNHPHKFETITKGYFLLNAFCRTRLRLSKQIFELGLYASNILNASYFDHLSTLKDVGYYNMGRSFNLKCKIPIQINR